MKLDDMNLPQRVYGDVPQSFQHRVEYALRQTKEERPMKRFTLRAVALVLVLVAIASIACAAVLSNTTEFFGEYYGASWRFATTKGDIDTTHPSVQIGDLIYTMDDVIVTGISLDDDGFALNFDKCGYILATGTIKPAEDANVVIIPEDHAVTDPWNVSSHYVGHENVPADAVSVLAKAQELDAKILCARVTANGILDENGDMIPCSIGYEEFLQEDGTLMFSMEIQLDELIERQDAYTLSVYVANHEVDAEDNHLMDTRQAEDWVFTIKPTAQTD